MTIEAATDKLNESRFFLKKLEQEKAKQARVNKPEPAHFRYYLSAFLTAAQSVRQVVGDKQEDELKKFLRKKRVGSVHFGRLKTKARTERLPVTRKPDAHQGRQHFYMMWNAHESGGSWTEGDVYYFEIDGTDHDVVEVCERHLDHLAKLVQDFTEKG